MNRKDALVRLVAGQMAKPDSWVKSFGMNSDGEKTEQVECYSEPIDDMVFNAEAALAEIEKVSGSPLDDALAAAGLDDVEKLTPWIKSMRVGRAKIEAEQRERDAKVAEAEGTKWRAFELEARARKLEAQKEGFSGEPHAGDEYEQRQRVGVATNIAAAIRGGG